MNDPSAKWDPLSKIIPECTPQAKCYKDIGESYATNEVTIYWNSPLVYMLSFIAINEPQTP